MTEIKNKCFNNAGAWHYVLESLLSVYKALESILNSMKTIFLVRLRDGHEMQ